MSTTTSSRSCRKLPNQPRSARPTGSISTLLSPWMTTTTNSPNTEHTRAALRLSWFDFLTRLGGSILSGTLRNTTPKQHHFHLTVRQLVPQLQWLTFQHGRYVVAAS